MKAREIAKLVKTARDGATGSAMQIGELLRVCMRLGSALSNEELLDWARKEASGYDENDILPDYRVISAEARGDFLGPFQSGLKNAQIPNSIIDKEHRDTLLKIHLRQPITELENYSRSGKSALRTMWSGDAIAHYQQREIYSNGMVLASAWNPISTQQFTGIMEVIRTRVLDFMIKIENELGIDVDEPELNSETTNVSQQQITNIFHNTIYGENIAVSNAGDAQANNIHIEVGNVGSLKAYLETIGVNKSELEELESAIENDPRSPKKELGPKVSKWLGRITIKGIKGGLTVGRDIAATIIAEAIMRYYGLK